MALSIVINIWNIRLFYMLSCIWSLYKIDIVLHKHVHFADGVQVRVTLVRVVAWKPAGHGPFQRPVLLLAVAHFCRQASESPQRLGSVQSWLSYSRQVLAELQPTGSDQSVKVMGAADAGGYQPVFCSSVGQSERLLTVRSEVRALPEERKAFCCGLCFVLQCFILWKM